MIASLYRIIVPYLFVPGLQRIETALHTGNLNECLWAVDAALRDPVVNRGPLVVERLRAWRNEAAQLTRATEARKAA